MRCGFWDTDYILHYIIIIVAYYITLYYYGFFFQTMCFDVNLCERKKKITILARQHRGMIVGTCMPPGCLPIVGWRRGAGAGRMGIDWKHFVCSRTDAHLRHWLVEVAGFNAVTACCLVLFSRHARQCVRTTDHSQTKFFLHLLI